MYSLDDSHLVLFVGLKKHAMTKEERSAKAKEAAFKRQLNKINPAVVARIQGEFAEKLRDSFEREYGVGKHAPQAINTQAPRPTYPTYEEWMQAIMHVEAVVHRTHNMTTKEEVKVDTNRAEVLTMALRRIALKVTTS